MARGPDEECEAGNLTGMTQAAASQSFGWAVLSPDPDRPTGFAYAATGHRYVQMAVQSAWSLRRHHPDLPIDLFADISVTDPVFDRVYSVEVSSRPKMEALYRSRFARTVLLDADTIIVAPISDVFELLENFDIVAAHDPLRNSVHARRSYRQVIPSAFPQINSGLLGVRKSRRTDDFLTRWATAFQDHGIGVDQPSLRELLWAETVLRLGVLPAEYNFWDIAMLDALNPLHAAPRVLHSYRFGQPEVMAKADPKSSEGLLLQALGEARYRRLAALLDADGTVPGHRAPPATEHRFEPTAWRSIRTGRMRDVIRKVPKKLGLRKS